MSYKIVVDSCCELPAELRKNIEFESVPLTLIVGDVYEKEDDETFDQNSASKNIKMVLDTCGIPHGSDELELFDDWIRGKFDDGVDLVIYFRNKIVYCE